MMIDNVVYLRHRLDQVVEIVTDTGIKELKTDQESIEQRHVRVQLKRAFDKAIGELKESEWDKPVS